MVPYRDSSKKPLLTKSNWALIVKKNSGTHQLNQPLVFPQIVSKVNNDLGDIQIKILCQKFMGESGHPTCRKRNMWRQIKASIRGTNRRDLWKEIQLEKATFLQRRGRRTVWEICMSGRPFWVGYDLAEDLPVKTVFSVFGIF